MCLFDCIAGLVSENPLAVNVLTTLKNYWNLQKRTFIPLFQHSQPNLVRKRCLKLELTFQDCLITRWLPTTNILVVIERNYTYQFKSNYLKKHKFSCNNFFLFLESTLNFKISETKTSLLGQVFLKLLIPKDVII